MDPKLKTELLKIALAMWKARQGERRQMETRWVIRNGSYTGQ